MKLGVHLSEQEATVFAYACLKDVISMTDVKSVINRGAREARAVVNRLVVQRLLDPVELGVQWGLVAPLKERFRTIDQPDDQPHKRTESLVTDQPVQHEVGLVTPGLTKLSKHQRRIILFCEVPRMQADIMKELGLTHRTFFRRKHLEPLIQANLVRMTHPDEPIHPNQAYVVTEAGFGLLASWKDDAGSEWNQ